MKILFRAALAAIILSVAASSFAQVGDALDVPTLLNGDGNWTYTRTLQINAFLNNDGVDPGGTTAVKLGPLPLNTTDNFTMAYTGTINTATVLGPDGLAGAQPDGLGDGETANDDLPTGFLQTKVYRRVRQAGAVFNLSGSGPLTALGLNLAVSVRVTGDSSLGYFTSGTYSGARFDWLSVGDLSMVRDTLGIRKGTPASLVLSGGIAAFVTIGNPQIGFGLAIDHGITGGGSGWEWADFPAITAAAGAPPASEQWTIATRRQVAGNLFIHATYSVLGNNGTLDEAITIDPNDAGFDIPMTERLESLAVTDPGGVTNTYSMLGVSGVATNDENVYYAPARHSMSYWSFPNRVLINQTADGDTETVSLNNFVTRSTNAPALLTNPISGLSISPPTPDYGQPFTISGTITANSSGILEYSVLVPGAGGGTGVLSTGTFPVPAAGGAFTSTAITAPSQNDNSPMAANSASFDKGSFGIMLRRTGQEAAGVPTKVLTVRLVTAGATPSPSPSPSPSASPSPSPTATPIPPTASPSPSRTPSPSPSVSPSPSPSPTASASPTVSLTPSPSPINSPSPSASPTVSATPSISPTESQTPTPGPTASPSDTPTPTETETPTPAATDTPTPTETETETPTPGATQSPNAVRDDWSIYE